MHLEKYVKIVLTNVNILGVLLGYVLGSLLPWHQLAYTSAVPPAILIIGTG